MSAEAEPKQDNIVEESENNDSTAEKQIDSDPKVEESAPAASPEPTPDKDASIEENLTNKEAPSEAETADKNNNSESTPTQETSKDKVLFLSEEDAKVPSTVILPEPSEEDGPHGPIFPNGEINWNCPCFGDMAVGPCGVEFRAAFECFHYSTADPKGSDCIDKFADMQICMTGHPELFEKKEREGGEEEESASEAEVSAPAAEVNAPAAEVSAEKEIGDSKVDTPAEQQENQAENSTDIIEEKAAEAVNEKLEDTLPSENLESKASS